MANGGKSGPKWAHATANKGGGGEEGGGGGERRAVEEGVSQEGRSSEAALRNEHRLIHNRKAFSSIRVGATWSIVWIRGEKESGGGLNGRTAYQ